MATQPSPLACHLASALVGIAVAVAVAKLFGRNAGLIGLAVGYVAHEKLDAPVARYLTQPGL